MNIYVGTWCIVQLYQNYPFYKICRLPMQTVFTGIDYN